MIVQCEQVTKRFESRTVVDQLDLEVRPGTCFGLLGPNGAGKTTTLKMIYGMTAPSEGRIEVFGEDVTRDPRAVRRRLGVTLQENALIDVLSPVDNLRVFGRYHLMGEAAIDARIEVLLDFLGLRSHAQMPVKALSGGYQRRVAVAQSLMNDPELLILDEPTTGLDPAVRRSLWGRIRELRAGGTTVLLTTHYMEEAERLCDELVILADGRVVAHGAPKALIRDVLAPETVELELPVERRAKLLAGLSDVQQLDAGSHLMLYADDGAALLGAVRRLDPEPGLVAVRQTNLEDVFLALTGTGLEEGA